MVVIVVSSRITDVTELTNPRSAFRRYCDTAAFGGNFDI